MSHRFSLRQLEYAVAVADTLNFRKAAERCNVSQPSLSAQVAQLEEAIGVRLFERDRRRVIVTARCRTNAPPHAQPAAGARGRTSRRKRVPARRRPLLPRPDAGDLRAR